MTMRVRLSKGDQAAVDATKFCLLNGRPPFRVDIEILLRLVDAAYETGAVGEQAREGK